MASSKNNISDWGKNIKSERVAAPTIRGFHYQFLHAVFAWLELKDNQTLLIEGVEDFDIIDENKKSVVQIKDKKAALTLRSNDAIDSINNFWELQQSQSSPGMIFEFITTSNIGIEQEKPFGDNGGIFLWQNCRNNTNDLNCIVSFLKNDGKVIKKLSQEVKDFLKKASNEEIFNSLIKPINWVTASDNVDGIEKSIEDKLIFFGSLSGIPPSYCLRVRHRLISEMLTKASQPNYSDRLLNKKDFLFIFEEETRTSLPANIVNELKLAGLFGNLPGAPEDMSLSFAPSTILDKIPPIGTAFFTRDQHMADGQQILTQTGLLIIHGASGIGKSTLAKQIANLNGNKWHWFSLPDETLGKSVIINKLYAFLNSMDSEQQIVIDNFNIDSVLLKNYEDLLSVIFFLLNENKHSLIITSHKPIPKRLARRISLTQDNVYELQEMSEDEIIQYIKISGCPNAQLATRAKEIYIHTSGHTQLVHARVLALQSSNWAKTKVRDFISGPPEIKEEQKQAQQLLYHLTDDEKMIICFCSVIINSFYKSDIINIAQKWNINLAGDIFDKLEGPYIERKSKDLFKLTPLLKNAASNALSESDIEKIHFEYANTLFSSKSIPVDKISAILMHSMLGKNDAALMSIIYNTLQSEENQKNMLYEYIDWFLVFNCTSENSALYPNHPTISRLLRCLQFSIASCKKPEETSAILRSLQEEIQNGANDTEIVMLYATIFKEYKAHIPVNQFFEILRQYSISYKALDEKEDFPFDFPESDLDFGPIASFLALRIQQFKSLAELMTLFHELDSTDEELRTELLSLFQEDVSYIDLMLNQTLWNERDNGRKDWQEFIDSLDTILTLSKEWDCISLCAAITKYIGLVHHDQLDNLDVSIEILSNGKSLYPNYKDIFCEQLADIYLVQNNYEFALEEIMQIPTSCKFKRNCFKPQHSVFRKRGQIFAKLENWDKAAVNYVNASDFAEKQGWSIEAASLLGDAALAYWFFGNNEGMDACLNNALKMIRPFYKGYENIKALTAFRMIALVIRKISFDLRLIGFEDDSIEPWVGICSSSEPNEKLLELVEIPISTSVAMLGRIERELDLPLNALSHKIDMQKHASSSSLFAMLQIHQCFKNNEFDDLPKIIFSLVKRWEQGLEIMENNGDIFSSSQKEIPEIEVFNSEKYYQTMTYLIYSAAVCLIFGSTELPHLLSRWRKDIPDLPSTAGVIRVIDTFSSYFNAPSDVLLNKLYSKEIEEELVSAILLLVSDDANPKQLLQRDVYLYSYFIHNKAFCEFPEHTLSALISQSWQPILCLRFHFRSPDIYIPQITKVLQKQDSYKKIGELIVITAEATTQKLTDSVLSTIKHNSMN
jgi:conflict system STAND superfamily ATPase/Cap4-like dsDNA endonuclease family protein